MIKYKCFAYFLIFLIPTYSFITSKDSFTDILRKLNDYTNQYPQEKVYLQFDKPYYAAGDDIWFKAYLLNTKTQVPSLISSFLYVELINNNDSLIYRHKYALTSGLSWGDFHISDALPEGNYRIRAYTQYMRNFRADFFFDKTIRIANANTSKVITQTQYTTKSETGINYQVANIHFENKDGIPYAENKLSYEIRFGDKILTRGNTKTGLKGDAYISWKNAPIPENFAGRMIIDFQLPGNQSEIKSIPIMPVSNAIDVQFLPEGGKLIEGMAQRIAVKAINANGRGEAVSGTVADHTGNVVAGFKTNKLGMGSFVLKIIPTKIYTAKLRFDNGGTMEVKLPKADRTGCVLSIDNMDSTMVKIKITVSDSLVNNGELKVVAQQGGNIYYVSKAIPDKNVLTANLPRTKLPIGIIQFTLFSAGNIPLAERLIFNRRPDELLNLKIDSSKISSSKTGKTGVAFQAFYGQKPVIGSFSVAVIRFDHTDGGNESNILTSLLLTSDLAGFIENPNYYFSINDTETRTDLDNLMLTQGWRRFSWMDVINNTAPPITFVPEQSSKITGTVTKKGKAVEGAEVTLMGTKNALLLLNATTNAQGRFVFDSLSFSDSTKFVLQTRGKDEAKLLEIHIDTLPELSFKFRKHPADVEVNVNKSLMAYIKSNDQYLKEMARLGIAKSGINLEEVTISDNKKPTRFSQNLNGPGNADYIITDKQIMGSTSLLSALMMNGPIKTNLGFNGGYLNGGTATLILNGLEITYDDFRNISTGEVASVELLKFPGKTGVYGNNALKNGVIVITTWPPGLNPTQQPNTPGLITYQPLGISVARTFYVPKYQEKAMSDKTDSRTTVYWNPQLLTDENGKINFDFYNTSEKGLYRMVIEGIDIDGHLARKVLTYTVK